MNYYATYRCRLCGETYRSGATTGRKVAERCMTVLAVGVRGLEPMEPTMNEVHHCGGDHARSLGLSDFLGWKAEEET